MTWKTNADTGKSQPANEAGSEAMKKGESYAYDKQNTEHALNGLQTEAWATQARSRKPLAIAAIASSTVGRRSKCLIFYFSQATYVQGTGK